MQKISLLISFIILTCSAWGQNSPFEQGNEYYKNGKYDEAIAAYEQLVKNDEHAAAVYYNLGNAYFKKGDLASAILNYERAYKLNPSDKDIRDNLNYANAQIVDKIEAPKRFFLAEWTHNLIKEFHSNIWAYLGIACWALLFFSIMLFIRTYSEQKRKLYFSIIILALGISLFSFYAAYSQYDSNESEPFAIVFAQNITAKSTPSNNGTDLFILHTGTKVKVLDKVGTWYKVQLADEREGWLPTKELTKI